jgi:hypothetical protein
MAETNLCSTCGKAMKPSWLVCKHCGKARWKLITPYYTWGITFLVFAWWSLTNQMNVFTPIPYLGPVLVMFLPVIGGILGVIGLVMLVIAAVATLKSLFAR